MNYYAQILATKKEYLNSIATGNGYYANLLREKYNDFPDHKGRPGKVGGSLPKGESGNQEKSISILKSKEEVRKRAIELTKNKAPIIKIQNDEFAGSDVPSKRAAAKEYYIKKLKGKPFKNKNSGQTIICGDEGKTFSQTGYENKINSFKYLDTILQESEYLGKDKDVNDRKDIKAFHYYACKVKTPQGNQILLMSVRELKDGKFYYNHHITQEQSFKSTPVLPSGTQNSVNNSIAWF